MPDDSKPADSKPPAPTPAQTAPAPVQPVQAAPAQVKAPGIAPMTTPGRVMRRYAHITDKNTIREIVEVDSPPKPKEGERVVDVSAVPAFPGNVVDAVGNVSPATMSGAPSAQALVPEVTPATVPAASVNALPIPPNTVTGS